MIGHNISMINVQAGAALHRLKKDPAQAEEALGAIKAGSRETLRELRATLGVLRRVDEAAPTAPAPGLARVDELVASAKLAGRTVRIARTGVERPLPAPVDLAAYRIMQESLTNAARHSGAGRVSVRLSYEDEELAILMDALVIRCLIVPALMQLMGKWAWWLPAPLARRLPRVALERPADS